MIVVWAGDNPRPSKDQGSARCSGKIGALETKADLEPAVQALKGGLYASLVLDAPQW